MLNKLDKIADNISFSERVRLGIQKALIKLAHETAEKNGTLVVKINGEIKEVAAKDLLNTLPKE
ncbi:hypothetical protein [Sphingobacterium sp. MYb388]|uniref:hypothetical protein n=1 Tax=Sphingobacterium sp. MYb388 TaxID=2745437 RepID=UPI0030B58ED8